MVSRTARRRKHSKRPANRRQTKKRTTRKNKTRSRRQRGGTNVDIQDASRLFHTGDMPYTPYKLNNKTYSGFQFY